MMSKYNSILIKIKLFYLILIGRIKKSTNSIKIFKNNSRNIKNILIIFPLNYHEECVPWGFQEGKPGMDFCGLPW